MINKTRAVLRRAMAMLLCVAMLLSNVGLPIRAADSSTSTESATNTEVSQTKLNSVYRSNLLIENVNYYVPGESVLVYAYKAYEFSDANYPQGTGGVIYFDGVAMNEDARNSFISYQPDFKEYTAFIIEFFGFDTGMEYEYFVEAVIDGSKASDVEMTHLAAKTQYGFVLYVPTERLKDMDMPCRGDLYRNDFWHVNLQAGATDLLGHAYFANNPTASLSYAAATDVNATVKLFNYDSRLNTMGLGQIGDQNGFSFWSGFWGYGGEIETIDGAGIENEYITAVTGSGAPAFYHGLLLYPQMAQTLNANGYPQIDLSKHYNVDENGYLLDLNGNHLLVGDLITGNEDYASYLSKLEAANYAEYLSGTGSLGYLFSDGFQVGQDMSGGGGLFQMDEEGYYYYDSMRNAAYFDQSQNRFVLYDDLIVRPWYNANSGEDAGYQEFSGVLESYGNFLPFNKVTPENVTIDGSLEAAGMTDAAVGKLLSGNKSLTDEMKEKIANGTVASTTARLEEQIDFWFGMTVDFEFVMPENGQVKDPSGNLQNMKFEFDGDDDVFVYVGVWNGTDYDYKLVLDIGGVHGNRAGTIDFATGEVVYHAVGTDDAGVANTTKSLKDIFGLSGDTFGDYTQLSLKFFYMERGSNISHCKLRFNIPAVPANSLTVSKELAADDDSVDIIEKSYNHQFRVIRAEEVTDENGAVSYIPATDGGEYVPYITNESYKIVENGQVVGTGMVDDNGYFTLKAGQSALFENMVDHASLSGTYYVVQEIVEEELLGQYNGADYIVIGNGGAASGGTGSAGMVGSIVTSGMHANQIQSVTFTNKVVTENLGMLNITKVVEESAKATLGDRDFEIYVTLDGTALPVGTQYTVLANTAGAVPQTHTVNTAGMIELADGETATISCILAGTQFVVAEKAAANGEYKASYSGTVTPSGTTNITTDSISGEVPVQGVAYVTVTNNLGDGLVVDKYVTATDDPYEFLLTLEAFGTGTSTQVTATKAADIVLVVDQSATMYTPAGAGTDRIAYNSYCQYASIKDDYGNYYTNPNYVAGGISGTVFQTMISQEGGDEILENAGYLGYYIAVHNTYNFLYIVQYLDGGWYYVPVDQTVRTVKVDTANTVNDSSKAFYNDKNNNGICDGESELIAGTYAQDDRSMLTNVTYYKSQYGAFLDSARDFVKKVNRTGVNHRIAVVGFSSPFYDCWNGYDGTGIYIDGQYHLYDTDYLYLGYYDSSNTLVYYEGGDLPAGVTEDDLIILDPDRGHATSVFTPYVADSSEYNRVGITADTYENALVGFKDDKVNVDGTVTQGVDRILNSVNAIRSNYQQTCPAVGLKIAQTIFESRSAAEKEARDEIVILFTDGVPTVGIESDREKGFSENAAVKWQYWHGNAGVADAINIAYELKNGLVSKGGSHNDYMTAVDANGDLIDDRFGDADGDGVMDGFIATDPVTIYTIGTSSKIFSDIELDPETNTNSLKISTKTFLEQVSSHYADAKAKYTVVNNVVDGEEQTDTRIIDFDTTYQSADKPTASGYAKYASTDDEVSVAFGSIINSTVAPNVELNGDDILKEVISDYFTLMSGSSEAPSIRIYTAAYKGAGSYTSPDSFNSRVMLGSAYIDEDGELVHVYPTDDSKPISITTSQSPNYSVIQNDVVIVKGYDYSSEYLSTEARTKNEAEYFGSKLIVEVLVRTRNGFWGGNNVPTNAADTAIYDRTTTVVGDQTTTTETPVMSFPMPEVNVPVVPTVTTQNVTVYYGGEVNSHGGTNSDLDLLAGVTAGGLSVTINQDGTFTAQQSWMDDFVDMKWTSTTVPSSIIDNKEPDTYTYTLVMDPKYNGTENRSENPSNIAGTAVNVNGVEATADADVNVLVPVVTFQDSTINLGYEPDSTYFEKNNRTSDIAWVDSVTGQAGTATDPDAKPELTFGYEADGTIFGDDASLHFLHDTKVQVSVTSSDVDDETADITEVTTFKWLDCNADHLEIQPDIPTHSGTESYHEFWIHVPNINVNPDVVVIDFGLPVNIDVLSNDPKLNGTVAPTLVGILVTGENGETSYVTVDSENPYTGDFGDATVLSDGKIRYSVDTMSMSEAEVFTYVVRYEGSETLYQATVTVIPATIIYYEDGFVDCTNGTTTGDNNHGTWSGSSGDADATQAEDRPGLLNSLDANNIYGYDSAYSGYATYSLGSANMVTVSPYNNPNTKYNPAGTSGAWPKAEFSFTGTGFDVVSVTNSDAGMITVQVKNTAGDTVVSYIVDNYYGYIYADGTWTPAPSASSALYQVPVIKVAGLTYGSYQVVITPMYSGRYDHDGENGAGNGEYSFWLDAIRVYNPAGTTAEELGSIIGGAYDADSELFPTYLTVKSLLVGAQDFNSSADSETVSGIIFVDGNSNVGANTSNLTFVSDYANAGPNNETYLKQNQGIAFKLRTSSQPARVHLAMKLAYGSSVDVLLMAVGHPEGKTLECTIQTATDLYYNISDLIEWTAETAQDGSITYVTTYPIAILNNSADNTAMLSLTNLKCTGSSAAATSVDNTIEPVISQGDASDVYGAMRQNMVDTAGDDAFVPQTFGASFVLDVVNVNAPAMLTIRTSADVAAVTVDGAQASLLRTDAVTGEQIWTYTVDTAQAGTYTYHVVARNESGTASDPLTVTLTVADNG